MTISYCCAEHWAEHGDHEPGAYGDCVEKSVEIPDGAAFGFDADAENGTHLLNKCNNEGFE